MLKASVGFSGGGSAFPGQDANGFKILGPWDCCRNSIPATSSLWKSKAIRRDPIFLECGLIGDHDWGMVFAFKEVIERDDCLYIYYNGQARLHTARVPGSDEGGFSLATLRKDGFVSIDTLPGRDGYLLTKPLECPGGRLRVNARTGKEGFVKVAIRRGDGELDGDWIPQWNYDANVPVSGDSTGHVVNWRGQESLDGLKGKAVRVHFWLRDAELFSFWCE